MRSKAWAVLFAFVIAVFPIAATLAGPKEDAEAAYKRGDFATAYQLYWILAEEGNAVAARFLGDMYIDGHGVPQDYAEALKWYRRAAERGDARAQRSLGVMYYDGAGVTGSYTEAAKWQRRAADQGDADAQVNLGNAYVNGDGVPQDYAEAVKWYRRAADQGNARAQFCLGIMYDDGHGVPQNDTEAVKWFRLAAEHGLAQASDALGSIYAQGHGVPRNGTEAVKWYRLAAEQGDARDQLNLGTLYVKGDGVPQDYAEALKWFRLAAEQGDPQAQVKLGTLYLEGKGVPQDHAEAAKWFRRAADQGNALAESALGDMYLRGDGVPSDYTLAYMWFDLAAARGFRPAQEGLDTTAKLMTPAQIAQAQKLSSTAPAGKPAANAGVAQADESTWAKLCTKNEQTGNKQSCLVQHGGLDPSRGIVLGPAAVRSVEGEDKLALEIGLTTDYSLTIPAGVQIKIDDGEPISLQYVLCFATGCLAVTELTKENLDKIRKGKQMSVAAINMQEQRIGFLVPLTEFGEAYDGPPADTAKYQEAWRQLIAKSHRRQIELANEIAAQQKEQGTQPPQVGAPPQPGAQVPAQPPAH